MNSILLNILHYGILKIPICLKFIYDNREYKEIQQIKKDKSKKQ